jgi:triosephosphate isomerase
MDIYTHTHQQYFYESIRKEYNERVTTGAEKLKVLIGVSVHNSNFSDLHKQTDGNHVLKAFSCKHVDNLL